jgi:hypothetical protein
MVSVTSALLLVLAGGPATATCLDHAQATTTGVRDAVPGELIVTFKSGTPLERTREINASLGVAVIRTMLDGQVQHVRLPSSVSVAEMQKAYLMHPEVGGVEPNRKVRVQ